MTKSPAPFQRVQTIYRTTLASIECFPDSWRFANLLKRRLWSICLWEIIWRGQTLLPFEMFAGRQCLEKHLRSAGNASGCLLQEEVHKTANECHLCWNSENDVDRSFEIETPWRKDKSLKATGQTLMDCCCSANQGKKKGCEFNLQYFAFPLKKYKSQSFSHTSFSCWAQDDMTDE